MGWFSDLVSDFGAGISEAGSNAVDYFTSPEGVVRLGSMGLGAQWTLLHLQDLKRLQDHKVQVVKSE